MEIIRYYAGIGARDTPPFILETMKSLAEYLYTEGWILRSGGAGGADLAFEAGCGSDDKKEIYLPWKGFNNSSSKRYKIGDDALLLASEFHPYWGNLKRSHRLLQARNGYQVLGENLNTFSDLVICYTKNGTVRGGTGQALRIANSSKYNIPVLNLGNPNLNLDIKSLKEEIDRLVLKQDAIPRLI